MFLLPAVAQFIWFVPGSMVASFQEFVPFFHSLQYLLIAWAMHLFERFESQRARGAFVLTESAKWSIANFIGGSVLFYFLPMFGAWAGSVPLAFATGVVISGVQIHHFFVDGVIWKLKRKTVVSPLLMSLSDLQGSKGLLEAAPA
jgi:hypothetical protein